MDQSTQPTLSQNETETFTVLALRYLDGGCSLEEIKHLKDALSGSAVYRELFVQVCRMHGNLHETFAHKRDEMKNKAPKPEAPLGDPGAETIISELSGEDTIHPAPKEQES